MSRSIRRRGINQKPTPCVGPGCEGQLGCSFTCTDGNQFWPGWLMCGGLGCENCMNNGLNCEQLSQGIGSNPGNVCGNGYVAQHSGACEHQHPGGYQQHPHRDCKCYYASCSNGQHHMMICTGAGS